MNITDFFINPQTRLLRSGWRVLAFLFVLTLPQWLMTAMLKSPSQETNPVFDVSVAMILVYVILVGWVLLVSWGSLRFLDRRSLRSLGFSLHANWRREVLFGLAISLVMIAVIVGLQVAGGGTRTRLNPFWFKDENTDWAALGVVSKEMLMALVLLILAGAFEELVYRGYAFQTLLRGISPVVPILVLSVFFALGHWNNPNRTVFSTINTVLAGVWLSAAYLKTRSLWLPTALHVGWNYVMGALFGLPVSGLFIPQHPILISTCEAPLWLTGGSYGPEGGAAASLVVIVSLIFIWRTKWLAVAPEMQNIWTVPASADASTITLNLQNDQI
ncbi:MAG: CPBP family intramembrane metalloprotease [Acidobacteria bacterium]|nr:CPBP family intramembrane metalloprotease [Acidobacteriota bacterium]